MNTDDLPPAPRTVRPRARRYRRLPIVVVGSNDPPRYYNEDGTYWNEVLDLPSLAPTLFVANSSGDWVAALDARFSVTHPDTWQWRVTTQEKGISHPGGRRVAARVSAIVHYFGFRPRDKSKAPVFHKIIDPIVMYGKRLDDIWSDDAPENVRLMRWGQAIRDFCDANNMEVRPTIGSISAQFLTDQRFYPHARRKVPHTINDRARPEQPANYYALSPTPSARQEFNALYLDQRRAHHYHARTIHLPDANNLFAHGRFTDLGDIVFERPEPDFYGLYCLHMEVPQRRNRMLHWINPKAPYDFVFSNELPLLLDLGYKVNGVIAAWGSNEYDRGLRRYACWADQQLDSYHDAAWLKPLLLATYGTLATRPSWGETIFKLARVGTPATVYTGRRHLTGLQIRSPHRLEPKIANVIHRGMIEAATRAESVGLAHYLTHQGYRVLAIYADAVIIEDDGDRPQPPLLEPWRLKTTLTHLQFVNKQAFISGEMTKLPGVSRELLAYSPIHGAAPQRKLWNPATGRRWTKPEMLRFNIKPRRI